MAAPMRFNFCSLCKTYLHSFKFNRILATKIQHRTELRTATRTYVRCHHPYLLLAQRTVILRYALYSSNQGTSDADSTSSSSSDSGGETSDSDSDIELAADVVDAVKDVASSLTGDQAQVESDLLRQLRSHAALTEHQKHQAASQQQAPSFSNLFAGMKIDTGGGEILMPTAKGHTDDQRIERFPEREDRRIERFPEKEDRRIERFPEREDRRIERFPEKEDRRIERFPEREDRRIERFPEKEDRRIERFPEREDRRIERFPEKEDRAPRSFPTQKHSVIDQVVQGSDEFTGRMPPRDQHLRPTEHADDRPSETVPEREDRVARPSPTQRQRGSVIGQVTHGNEKFTGKSVDRDQHVRAIAQRQGSVIDKLMDDRKSDKDALFSAEPLNIFIDMTEEDVKQVSLSTEPSLWDSMECEELERYVYPPPTNAFEEMIQWTKEGKLWHFPIDNDQGWKEEENVGFHEHVFLEHLISDFPSTGPIRHFMELVITGMSKNPFLTVSQKHEHVQWFRDYFKEKETVIKEALEQDASS